MTDLHHDQSEMNVLFVDSAVDDYPLSAEEFRIYAHIARRAGLGEAWPEYRHHCQEMPTRGQDRAPLLEEPHALRAA